MRSPRTRQRLAVGAMSTAMALSLGACGSVRPTADPVVPGTSLEFKLTGGGKPDEVLTLTCDPVAGTVPNPERVCAALSAPQKNPFPAHRTQFGCTQVDGDGAVHVHGTWRDRRIAASYGQQTSCDVKQWRTVLRLLGVTRPVVTATP